MKKPEKTNAMRQLDAAHVPYELLTYEVDENDLSGTHIASEIGISPSIMFKTLVAHGDKKGYEVFCIPSDREINLKKAAAVTGDKKIEMVHVKDLLALTGYIRGGCSPIGMKKKFPTWFDASVTGQDRISVSAGQRGMALMMNASDLLPFVGALIADVTE